MRAAVEQALHRTPAKPQDEAMRRIGIGGGVTEFGQIDTEQVGTVPAQPDRLVGPIVEQRRRVTDQFLPPARLQSRPRVRHIEPGKPAPPALKIGPHLIIRPRENRRTHRGSDDEFRNLPCGVALKTLETGF